MSEMERAGGIERLTARQAAARLGVKVETIYAYVSRGVLERVPASDGRQSLFSAKAVERLASRRRGGVRSGGLSVVLGTGLTSIEDERLSYRGLDAARLARETPYEAVAEWLWIAESNPLELDAAGAVELAAGWSATPDAVAAAGSTYAALPQGTPPADALRAITSAVGPTDPLRFDLDPRAVVGCGRRLIATLVEGLPRRGRSRIEALRFESGGSIPGSLAARLWARLTSEPAGAMGAGILNAALVLLADHGLATSTLAARVAASVRADPVSVVSTGLGTLSGPLHGAASASVHRLLREIGSPERAVAVLGEQLRQERLIPGFGHLIYSGWDPRARVLLDLLRTAELDAGRMEIVERVFELLEERAPVQPNIDFVLGSLTFAAGMEEGAGEAIFGVARCAGWIAHALEEYDEPPLRFRPRAHYVGPPPA